LKNQVILILDETLEHIDKPKEFLKKFLDLDLRKIFIIAPNYNRSSRVLDSYYCDYPPAHVGFFSKETLERLAYELNFSIKFASLKESNIFRIKYITKCFVANIYKFCGYGKSEDIYRNVRNHLMKFIIASPILMVSLGLIIYLSLIKEEQKIFCIFEKK